MFVPIGIGIGFKKASTQLNKSEIEISKLPLERSEKSEIQPGPVVQWIE